MVLRAEGVVLCGAAMALYFEGDYRLWPLLVFFLAPDLSFIAYLGGPRICALGYNLVHAYVFPVALAAGRLVAAAACPYRSRSSGVRTSLPTACSAMA